MSTETLVAILALVGLVLIVASLLSGMAEKSGLPPVAIFLGLGAALGPFGLGVILFPLDSPALRIIATLALGLVLFTDAMVVDLKEVRRHRRLSMLVLGPGTLLPALVIAVAAWALLEIHPAAAAILGAALASTDPVMLQGLLRRPGLPSGTRIALRLESGLNDVVLLPVVLAGLLFLAGRPSSEAAASLAIGVFLFGPLAGVLTGFIALQLLVLMRRRFGVRRDYESLYALGVALTAFAAAEAVHGSGFLAAFAAGVTIASLDVELCDCFLDYGQATAEMFLLLTFVALGAGVIWSGLTVIGPRTIAFAVAALAARTVVLLPVLGTAALDRRERWMIALYGPRGLSTLLLILLPVFAGVPGAVALFQVASLVVLLSLVVHGFILALPVWREGRGSPATAGAAAALGDAGWIEPAAAPAAPLPPGDRMTIEDVRVRMQRGEPVVIGDARSERSYAEDPRKAAGSMRLPPGDPVTAARRLAIPPGALIALYCT